MKKDELWVRVIFFLAGCFCCYITLQFSFFKIKYELDISSILLGLITVFVGLYIADVIQNKIIKRQSIYSILFAKIENEWQNFNEFSNTIKNAPSLDLQEALIFFKQSQIGIQSIRNYFLLFRSHTSNIDKIENELNRLDLFLDTLPISNNTIRLNQDRSSIVIKSNSIELLYVEILRDVSSL